MPNTPIYTLPYPAASDTVDVPRDVQALATSTENTIKAFRDVYDARISNPSSFRNVLINGGMDIWQRGTGSTSSPAGSRTFLADRWYVNPTGAAVTQARSTTVPTSQRSDYSLQITGATSVTTCLIGQRIEMLNTPQLKRTVTFSARIYNNTGGAFTPNLLIGTPGAADDFTTVTNRLTQALQSCANTAWTTVSHTVDISGYTNFDNGLQIEIQIPSGSLNTNGKSILVTEVQIEAGSVATPFERRPVGLELALCQRYFVGANSILTVYHTFGFLVKEGLPVTMRVAPTVTTTLAGGGTSGITIFPTTYSMRYGWNGVGVNPTDYSYTASAEL